MTEEKLFFDEEDETGLTICGCDDQYCTLPVQKMHFGNRVEKDRTAISEYCKTVYRDIPDILEVTG